VWNVVSSSQSTPPPSATKGTVPTTSIGPSTTAAITTTITGADTTLPYYSARPPRPYVIQEAGMRLADSGDYFGAQGYQLWAKPRASADGTWFSVQTFRGAPQLLVADAYRTTAGDRTAAITHTITGHTVAQFTVGGTATVTLTAAGLSDDEVAALIASITVDNGEAVVPEELTAGYRVAGTVVPWLAIEGVPVEQVLYAPSDDTSQGVRVTIGLPPIVHGTAPVDRAGALRYFLQKQQRFDAGGHSGIAGEVVGRPGFSLATWSAEDHIVTLSGNVESSTLIDIARTVHTVDDDHWRGMEMMASQNSATARHITANRSSVQPTFVTSGSDGANTEWDVGAAVTRFGTQRQITWTWDGTDANTWTTVHDTTAHVDSVVTAHHTMVFADVPRQVGAGARLRVTRPGGQVLDVAFFDADARLDCMLAAYVFSGDGPYAAEVLDGDGRSIARWPVP
jgi:hypothetical protein